jgi:nitrogen regulatory protein PII-like uncharacterized protein
MLHFVMWGGRSRPTIFQEGGIVKFTIVNTDSGSPFVQQQYDTAEDAEAALAIVKAKFGERYKLGVAVVDDEGQSQTSNGDEEKKTINPPSPSGPRPKPPTRR